MTVNGVVALKPNHTIRIGDTVAASQRGYRRRMRVASLGWRRGPAAEARLLYEEDDAPIRLADLAPAWEGLLAGDDCDD